MGAFSVCFTILGVGIPLQQWKLSDAVAIEELLDEATRELSFGPYVDTPIAPSAEFADRLERAHMAINRAIKIDDSSSRGHDCLGVYYLHRGDLQKAVREFKKAIELDRLPSACSVRLLNHLRRSAPSAVATAEAETIRSGSVREIALQ